MTNEQAYDAMTAKNVFWNRMDANHIVVWTAGYKTANHMNIESFLMQSGMSMISEDFDEVCGKTKAVYRHT